MVDIPTTEPLNFTAGETVKWSKSFDDYPASAGWELNYYLINSAEKLSLAFDTEVTDDDDSFLVTIPAATSIEYEPGVYAYQGFVTKAAETYKVTEGKIEIKISFADIASHDYRSHAKKVLAAIEAVLEKTATIEQKSYTIDGRSLERTPLPDLLRIRDIYRSEARREDAQDRMKSGLDSGKKLKVRFR